MEVTPEIRDIIVSFALKHLQNTLTDKALNEIREYCVDLEDLTNEGIMDLISETEIIINED